MHKCIHTYDDDKIMRSKRYNITVNKFTLVNEFDVGDMYNKLSSISFSEDRGYGFKNVLYDNGILSALLIFRVPSYIFEYNNISEELERKLILIYSECQFWIDMDNNIIYTLNSGRKFNMLKSMLFHSLMNNYVINSADISPYDMLQKIIKFNINFEIKELSIPQFIYQNGAVGRFNPKILNNLVGNDLIHMYKNDINKLKISISEFMGFSFEMHLSNNGLISLICEEDTWEEIFHNVKNLFK